MPILLPQLTRREFLRRAVLAGAGTAFAPAVFAELSAKPRDPDTFFFLADTHLAAAAGTRDLGVNMADQLAASVREALAWPVAPAAVIVNGDLAYKLGLPADYAAFGRLIEPLRALAPVHLTLGNHDQRENFWQAFPQDATRAGAVPQKQVAIFPSARANWFLLDSLDLTAATPGKLGQAQLDWLARELAARPGKPAMVVCHHPLDWLGGLFGLKDSPALAALLAQHRQVKAFIYAHTHNWQVSQQETGIQLINLPPTGYVFMAGRPSGWVRATLAAEGAEFELRSLDARHPEHAQLKKLPWRPA
jgi:hypothetical protein